MVRKITAILLLIIILTSLFIVVFSSLAYAKGVSPAWHCWEIGVQIVCKNGICYEKETWKCCGIGEGCWYQTRYTRIGTPCRTSSDCRIRSLEPIEPDK
jgi:hypothetical protein